MRTITFGVKDTNGYHKKLVVCNETKQYERGKLCQNSTFIDVWVKSNKDLDTIESKLKADGYTKTDNEFGKTVTLDDYKEWCKANGKKPCYATSLEEYEKSLQK